MDTYVVSMITDYGWGEDIHPLAVGVCKAVAKSIKRHFNKLCKWDDYSQTGQYVMMLSRTYCTNHKAFEKEVIGCWH